MATGGPCVGGSWVTFSSPLGTGEERKAHIYQGDQEKSPQKGLGAGPPPWAGPRRGRRSPHCGISRLPVLPRGLAHLDRGGRLALAAAASSARAARCSALTPSTWPGRHGGASEDVPLPDPFYQLNQMGAPPHPFHTQNTQKWLWNRPGGRAARQRHGCCPNLKMHQFSKTKTQRETRTASSALGHQGTCHDSVGVSCKWN